MSDQVQKFVFELVGPRAGKTCHLGPARSNKKYHFVNGQYSTIGTETGLKHLKTILDRSHNAHLVGSPEHAAAVLLWNKNPNNPEVPDGNSNVHAPATAGQAHAVPSNVQPSGSGTAAQTATVVKPNNDPKVSGVAAKTTAKG